MEPIRVAVDGNEWVGKVKVNQRVRKVEVAHHWGYGDIVIWEQSIVEGSKQLAGVRPTKSGERRELWPVLALGDIEDVA